MTSTQARQRRWLWTGLAAMLVLGNAAARAQSTPPAGAGPAAGRGGPHALSVRHVVDANPDYASLGTGECVAQQGCVAPARLPTCDSATTAAAQPIEQAWAARAAHTGTTVTIRGRLAQFGHTCTRLACRPDVCCNHCDSEVALRSPSRAVTLRLLRATPASAPVRTCRGDESGMCCGVAGMGQEVLATGILAPVRGDDRPVWQLVNPTLCRP